MATLIDTSVLIAWEREGAPELEDNDDTELALSVITASELLHGVHRANTAQRRHRRAVWIEGILEALPVVPVDLDVARAHARIWAVFRAAGQNIGAHDLLIGATAVAHGMRLASRNAQELSRIEGLDVVVW